MSITFATTPAEAAAIKKAAKADKRSVSSWIRLKLTEAISRETCNAAVMSKQNV